MIAEKLLFLRCALRHPQIVSWIAPTSPFTAGIIAKSVADPHVPQVIVELGAGSGAITRALLKRGVLHQKSTLIVIELLPALADFLRVSLKDSRCVVIKGDAKDLARMLDERGIRTVDAVVSGIPFSQLPTATGESIAKQIGGVLREDGIIAAYQVRPTVRHTLEPHFPNIEERWLPWNIPPLRLFVARR